MSEKTITEQANLTDLQATISARQIQQLLGNWILLPPIVCVGTAVIFFFLLSRINRQNFEVPPLHLKKWSYIAFFFFFKSILFIIPTLCVKIICIFGNNYQQLLYLEEHAQHCNVPITQAENWIDIIFRSFTEVSSGMVRSRREDYNCNSVLDRTCSSYLDLFHSRFGNNKK